MKLRKPSCLLSLLYLFVGVLVLLGVVVLISVTQNRTFVTTFYDFDSDKIDTNVRIVLLTDLHLRSYGEDNTLLAARVKDLKPDLIAIAGDMTLEDNPDHSGVNSLLARLTKIAPVYYSAGNHEYSDILYNPDSTLISDIEAAGAVYVDNCCYDLELKGEKFCIGGLCKNRSDILKYSGTLKMLDEMRSKDCFTLLLSHYPEGFIGGNMADYPFDLVLCGHAHGGQVRLPGTDGLYATDQGFLPKYTSGMRDMSGSLVVISRGLGDSDGKIPIPRINNQPELVVIDIE